jgi:hypothetical protein
MMYSSVIDWLGVASGPLLAVELLAFVAVVIVALAYNPNDARDAPGARVVTPRAALDEHLTKHEVTREEYVDRRKALDFSTQII